MSIAKVLASGGSLVLDSDDGHLILVDGSIISNGISASPHNSTKQSLETTSGTVKIDGGITFGAGGGSVQLRNGCTVTGGIDLGNGDESTLFVLEGASLSGDIKGGDDGKYKDSVIIEGKVTGNIDLGNGPSLLEIGKKGQLTGNVTLGDGLDRIKWGRDSTPSDNLKISKFTAGSGGDSLYLYGFMGRESDVNNEGGGLFDGTITAFKSDAASLAWRSDDGVFLYQAKADSGDKADYVQSEVVCQCRIP